MTAEPVRVVFDCVVFAQALINPAGPAGACVQLAERGECLLHVSPFILGEIRELSSKLHSRHGVTADQIESLIRHVRDYSIVVIDIPHVYQHPVDSEDSEYINLALATSSQIVVSRDRHLLRLMDRTMAEGLAFAQQCPALHILTPTDFLKKTASLSGE